MLLFISLKFIVFQKSGNQIFSIFKKNQKFNQKFPTKKVTSKIQKTWISFDPIYLLWKSNWTLFYISHFLTKLYFVIINFLNQKTLNIIQVLRKNTNPKFFSEFQSGLSLTFSCHLSILYKNIDYSGILTFKEKRERVIDNK